jgi:hypothetical protein
MSNWHSPAGIGVLDGRYLRQSQNLGDVANRQTALNNLTDVAGATSEHVLTKDTDTGNAIYKAAAVTTPGGSNTQIQFNDSGAFGGDSRWVFDKTTGGLGLGGDASEFEGYFKTIGLQFRGGNDFHFAYYSSGTSKIAFETDAANGIRFTTNLSSAPLQFEVGGAGETKMHVDNTGIGMGTTSPDTRLDIDAGAIEFAEMTAPGNGAANTARLYAVDNGAGKTQLVVIFGSGAAQVLATEP